MSSDLLYHKLETEQTCQKQNLKLPVLLGFNCNQIHIALRKTFRNWMSNFLVYSSLRFWRHEETSCWVALSPGSQFKALFTTLHIYTCNECVFCWMLYWQFSTRPLLSHSIMDRSDVFKVWRLENSFFRKYARYERHYHNGYNICLV